MYSDSFYLFDSHYKINFGLIHCENRSVRFYITYVKRYCFKLVIYPPPLLHSVLSANFENTVNDALGHANFREITTL